jgi:hypothetical protein
VGGTGFLGESECGVWTAVLESELEDFRDIFLEYIEDVDRNLDRMRGRHLKRLNSFIVVGVSQRRKEGRVMSLIH